MNETNPNADTGIRSPADGTEILILPVAEECVEVTTRRVETGRVTVRKSVTEREALVDEPTYDTGFEIERIAVNRVVDSAPPVRYEGDIMILSVLEEVLVVEKRLMLKEEIRIVRRRTERRDPHQVVLRAESVEVERTDLRL